MSSSGFCCAYFARPASNHQWMLRAFLSEKLSRLIRHVSFTAETLDLVAVAPSSSVRFCPPHGSYAT